MRIIVDANVVISAALSKFSVPFLALALVLDSHTNLISEKTFEELKVTLYQPKFDKYFFSDDTRPEILETILQYSLVIIPGITVTLCRDPNDDKYLELAHSGKADCIITGDPDLLELNPFENIPIITPKEFLDSISLRK